MWPDAAPRCLRIAAAMKQEGPGEGLAPLLKKLRAVHAVAVAGSSVGAAACLHVSQTAVVRAVQEVEAVLGQPLFERSASGMRATPLGELAVRRIARALDCLAQSPRRKARPGGVLAWQDSRLAASAGYRQLQVFLALQQAGREQGAAAALGVSASAVHQSLVQLEHLVGEALFLRGRSGLRLTEAGEAALKSIRLALAELAQADEEIAAQQGALQGRIVVGTLPFSTGLFLPRALERVLARHPGLAITVVDGTYDSLVHQLRFAEIDLIVGALRQAAPGPDLHQELLFEDPLAVVARRDHPLAGRRLRGLRDLRGADWVMPMPGTPAEAAFEQAFRAEKLPPPAAQLRINSPLITQALLAESDRLALMSPRQIAAEVRAGLLCVLPVAVSHGPRRIGVTTRADYLPPPGARELLETFRAVAQGLGDASASPSGFKQNA